MIKRQMNLLELWNLIRIKVMSKKSLLRKVSSMPINLTL